MEKVIKRIPAIHINHHNLKDILSKYSLSNKDINDIIKECLEFSIRNRQIICVKKQDSKKFLIAQDNNDLSKIDRFSKAYYIARQNANHKGIRIPVHGTTQYEQYCIALNIANEFYELYEFKSLDDCFNIFWKVVIEVLDKKFNVAKISFYKEKIFDSYESKLLIDNDLYDNEKTKEIYNTYNKYRLSYGYNVINYDMTNALHFIHTKSEINTLQCNVDNYIKSQFIGFEYLKIVPEPYQLYGNNAINRYQKFIGRQNYSIPIEIKQDISYWEKLKKRRDENNS